MMRATLPSLVLTASLLIIPIIASAQTAEELQQKINNQAAQISQLDQEIAQYQAQLDATSQKKVTLQNTIDGLNLQIKQLNVRIQKTKTQISSTQLTIQGLATSISGKQDSINSETEAVMESLRRLNESEDAPLVLQMLSAGNISDAWKEVDAIETLHGAVADSIDTLSHEKKSLEDTKAATEVAKAKLVRQQNDLLAQEGSVNAVKGAQNDLLKQTKAQESTYQTLITQKQAAKAQFEKALTDLNAQFQQIVNPSEYPAASAGLLNWPIDGKIRITQYFGNTPFADAHSSLYSGHGHDGIDIGAPIGTPIHAALGGEIIGTGNTDAIKSCYSFGKWVMIKHTNGLSTMYAHLSQIAVSKGDTVKTGNIIGYSGETGYATGPHLHFGVYVTAVTKIIKLGEATRTKTPCANAVMPVPPLSGYLNPLNYLPPL